MLSQSEIDRFHRDGFLRIHGVFRGAELAALRAAADRVEAEGLAEAERDFTDRDDRDQWEGRNLWTGSGHLVRGLAGGAVQYFRSERMFERDAAFRAVSVHPGLLTAIGQCMGHPFLPINDSLVAKQPHSETPIRWHQDPPYGNPEYAETFGVPNFDTDIYLDHSTVENGCVYGIPGKHLLGHLDLTPYEEEELFNDCGAVPIEMEPGDVLFHCISAPHGSRRNPTADKRRIFYVHYMAAEVVAQSYPKMFGAGKTIDFTPTGIATARR